MSSSYKLAFGFIHLQASDFIFQTIGQRMHFTVKVYAHWGDVIAKKIPQSVVGSTRMST